MRVDPTAPEIEFEGAWISWGALSAFADELDGVLRAAGLAESSPVGVVLRNRPEHVATILALLVSGRCVVTINAVQGDARLARELAELRLPVVVANAADWERDGLAEAARAGGSMVVRVAGPSPSIVAVESRPDPLAPAAPPRPGVAFELLTSGTTGPPKRVPLRYENLQRALVSAESYETAARGDRTRRLSRSVALVHSPLVHVSGIWRLLEALAAGRRIALAERFSVEAWRDMVIRHQPKSTSLVPAALRMVLDADLPPEDLSSLRAVVSGTAPLDVETWEAFEEKYGVPVLVVYGATEFAGGVAGWTVADRRDFRDSKRGSAGRANPGVELRVVDDHGDEQPAGTVGVLEVRSSQLQGDRWVRTTDLASIDEDGFLFIHGRTDDVIIRGGFKIDPRTIEAALEKHPEVAVACAVGLPDERLGAVPAAVVELVAGARVEPRDLVTFVEHELLGYQVPAHVVIVPALPRTPSMKQSRYEAQQLIASKRGS